MSRLPSPADFFAGLQGVEPKNVYRAYKEEMERELFTAAYRHYRGGVTAMARALGVNRNTVFTRLDYYGITRKTAGLEVDANVFLAAYRRADGNVSAACRATKTTRWVANKILSRHKKMLKNA